ncbi:MAG: hypothetical protein CSB06_00765 [Bacteroidia bacterium]|nr:MAG: hypothetical protein CSB06_00765 [Bacteroidia bacterium]
MKIELPHHLPKNEAFKQAEQLFVMLSGKEKTVISNLAQRTEGDCIYFSFSFMNKNIKGRLIAEEYKVTIELDLPLALRMFEGLIEQKLRGYGQKALASG